jgi:hypothetical protein
MLLRTRRNQWVRRRRPTLAIRRCFSRSSIKAVWVNPALPVRTLPEFVAYAKARPGQLNIVRRRACRAS